MTAPEDTPPEGQDEAPSGPEPCSPCRGTGKVISNLGGSPQTLDCPWCKGSGARIPGHDAQERFRAEGADAASSADGEEPPPAAA